MKTGVSLAPDHLAQVWGDALIESGRAAEALAMLEKAEPSWWKPPPESHRKIIRELDV